MVFKLVSSAAKTWRRLEVGHRVALVATVVWVLAYLITAEDAAEDIYFWGTSPKGGSTTCDQVFPGRYKATVECKRYALLENDPVKQYGAYTSARKVAVKRHMVWLIGVSLTIWFAYFSALWVWRGLSARSRDTE